MNFPADDESDWLKRSLTKRQKKKNRKKKKSSRNAIVDKHVSPDRSTGKVAYETPIRRQKGGERGNPDASRTSSSKKSPSKRPKEILKIYSTIQSRFTEWILVEKTAKRALESLENVVGRMKPIRTSFLNDVRGSTLAAFEGLEKALVLKHSLRAEKQRRNINELIHQMRSIVDEVGHLVEDVESEICVLSSAGEEDSGERTPSDPVSIQDYVEWSANIYCVLDEEYWRKRSLVESINCDRPDVLRAICNAWDGDSPKSALDSAWVRTTFAKALTSV